MRYGRRLIPLLLLAVLVVAAPADAGVVQVGAFGTSGPGTLSTPWGVAVDQTSGDVFVTDANDRVVRFGADGTYVSAFGTFGTGPGQFVSPTGIGIAPGGGLRVADRSNDRFQALSQGGSFLFQVGTFGSGAGQLWDPGGIAVDAATGRIYVADMNNGRIQVFDSSGNFTSTWGSPGAGNGQFAAPQNIAFSPDGNRVYVSDLGNDRIQVFAPDGAFLFAFGSTGSGPGQFAEPHGVAVDANGDVWVADAGNARLQRFSSNGTFEVVYAPTGGEALDNPRGVANGPDGTFYVADALNDRIVRLADVGAALTPSPRALGSVAVGDTSAPGTVTVTNDATAALPIDTITLNGADAAQFAVAGTTCGATLAAGASCTVDVTASPTSAGAKSATLRVDASLGTWSGNFTSTVTATGTLAPPPPAPVADGPPVVTGVGPGVGPTAGGELVTVTGANFGQVTAVLFGATPAPRFVQTASGDLLVTTPAHAVGPVHVTVVREGVGSQPVLADVYTFASDAVSAPVGVVVPPPSVGPGAGASAAGKRCVVPALTGLTLARAKARIAATTCRLGTVRGRARRGQTPYVARASYRAGTTHAAGTHIAVRIRGRRAR